ncbi:extracellular solute-binding protein [Paenibacillus alba]|uniref:Extracellular solute-binding protein n=1 Tax=Paenibacillus alba TaxID=1197127 RepID=A0ABU6GAJ8_9BACL|nr:extracellular solute-binding protein [Paenibacillus alba]MEC0231218.1 extracellular solute-binding protein [Paenibacillus alba]
MEKQTNRDTARKRLSELISMLREDILTGKRPVGDYLPSEKTFAEQYNLSNQLVRKGLDVLVSERLIEKIPRVGTKVVGSPDGSFVTVKFGYHTSVTGEADILRLLALFQKEHPHIRVQAVPLYGSDYGYIHNYLTGGILDVVMMNYTNFREFLEIDNGDLLEPMEPNSEISTFLSDGFTDNGRLLVQPFIFSPIILCYNRDHFLEANIPEPDSSWQWSDLRNNAAKLAIPNERLGFHCDFYSPNRWPLLPLQTQAKFERQQDGRIRLAGTKMMEALRICRDMKHDFPMLSEGITTGESERLLAQGKVSIIMTSYFYLNYLINENVSFDIAPVPHLGTPLTLLLNIGLAVNRHSQVKEAAVKLVDFLTSHKAQLFIRQQTYSLPALKSASAWKGQEELYRPSRFSLFRETIPSFHYFSDLGISPKELTTINQEAKLYWAGLETEEELISRIEGSLQLR